MPQTSKPDDVPVYRWQSNKPDYLWTYPRLKRAGLRPANMSRPDGVAPVKHRNGQVSWIWFYDVRQAKPYMCQTKRGKADRRFVQQRREAS